ncbi:MAG: hydantoinase/oxoprolinase N-terminal domain-containing protein, partial [Anaerolineae bacterium]
MMADSPTPIVGVDVGGTFTDFVYFDGGRLRIYKLLSTRRDPSVALLAGLRALDVAGRAVISHGTTVATNAVLEHTGARVALITTAGFRDLLAIGRQTRPALYRLAFSPRWVPVPEELRFEVTERIAATGEVVIPLDEREAADVLDRAVAAGAEALAVCLLFSFANPAHEQAIKRLAEARGLAVSLSCEILPEFREFERASTTALNAYVSPLMARYLDRLTAALASPPAPPLPGEGSALSS